MFHEAKPGARTAGLKSVHDKRELGRIAKFGNWARRIFPDVIAPARVLRLAGEVGGADEYGFAWERTWSVHVARGRLPIWGWPRR